MAKGFTIESGTPRTLSFEGVKVADGGSANAAGLYAVGNSLFLDGNKIAEDENAVGLHVENGKLYFGDCEIGNGAQPEPVQSGLWIPPAQDPVGYNAYSYADIIDAYDGLKDNSNYPGTITKHQYSENGHDGYPLYHYRFTPQNYTKTFYVHASIHGNERDAAQRLLRIMDIICNHANESAYSRLAQLRDNVRFIVIPVVSPWGFDNKSMNVPYTDWNGASTYIDNQGNEQPLMMNMNRNMDAVHQYSLGSSGNGGNYPFQMAETRHIKHVVESIGAHNIDYAVDYHDGDDVNEHFWFNYNADGANGVMCRQLLADLIEHEEELIANGGTDYRRPNAAGADSNGWVHPHVADANGYSTGTNAMWFNFTMGMLGSVCEYIGGYFGYPSIVGSGGMFTSEMVTRSLRIRANLLIYAYEMLDTKGWLVNEAQGAEYFHFDHPLSMTRQGLRQDGSDVTTSHTRVTIDEVYDRWDALVQNNPSYVTKSAKLGENTGGTSIYSYTLGNGNKKVLFIGGAMRWDVNHKETEFGMYVLAEYLCNDYIVNQSAFLKKLKQDYTIVVIPCIDIEAGEYNYRCLNCMAGQYKRWTITDGKCARVANANYVDTAIFADWIADHDDALVLVSGGEDTSGYAYEYKGLDNSTGKYSTDYMTQFILPKNMAAPQWLTDYCGHLEDDRGEDAPVVESSGGTGCADYAYDNYNHMPAVYMNLNVSQMWAARQQYMGSGDNSTQYMYRTYETGRRIANIVNIFLMAGGDIN